MAPAANDATRFEPSRLLLSFRKQAASWFKAGGVEDKRLIFEIVGSNPVLIDQELKIDAANRSDGGRTRTLILTCGRF